MNDVKDTRRALVRIGFDGRVHKTFRGHQAAGRFANEVRVLRWLEAQGCTNVPRVLEADAEKLLLVTSNCGARVEHLPAPRVREIFAELEARFAVRHQDAYLRNITYDARAGHFCVIDFEFAAILDAAAPPAPELDLPEPDSPLG
jgi:aminoglycoside/choline kinase family phosphotransferase